jgi:hypothetical protein
MGDRKGAHSILVGKTEGKRSLGWPAPVWQDNITIDLKKIG